MMDPMTARAKDDGGSATEPASDPGAVAGYAKGIARRAAIIETATGLFGRNGFRGATMVQIAEACGISRAGLLHHFPTKEGLLLAVLRERDRRDHARLAPRGDGPGRDALAQLNDLVALVEHNATIPAIVNLFAVLSAEAGDPGHPAHEFFVRRYAASRANFEHTLVLARERGILLPAVDPVVLAVELVALMDGLQVQWLMDPDGIDMAAVVRSRIESFLTVPLTGR